LPTTFINSTLDAYAFETLTVDATAGGIGFTASKLRQQIGTSSQMTKAIEALLTVETAPIRFTTDGTAPTAAIGHLLNAGDSVVVTGQGNLTRFKAFRTTGVSASVAVTYSA
jgi:hypothetical protein